MTQINDLDYLTLDFLGDYPHEMNQVTLSSPNKKIKNCKDTSFLSDFDHLEYLCVEEYKKKKLCEVDEKKMGEVLNEVFNTIIRLSPNSVVLTEVGSVINASLQEANILAFLEKEEQEEALLLGEFSDLDHLLKFDENYP